MIGELGIPCATSQHATGMSRCPRHDEPLGEVTRMCLACHNEAWDEVGWRYIEHGLHLQSRQPDSLIRDRGLVVNIRGKEHVTAEAWTTLGGMLGVVPVVEWTRPLEDGAGWEARVQAFTLDGRLVGADESMCSRSESHWRTRDEFALRSMAQTR